MAIQHISKNVYNSSCIIYCNIGFVSMFYSLTICTHGLLLYTYVRTGGQ